MTLGADYHSIIPVSGFSDLIERVELELKNDSDDDKRYFKIDAYSSKLP